MAFFDILSTYCNCIAFSKASLATVFSGKAQREFKQADEPVL